MCTVLATEIRPLSGALTSQLRPRTGDGKTTKQRPLESGHTPKGSDISCQHCMISAAGGDRV